MWLSLQRKANKYKRYVNSIEDITKYLKVVNREILIDTLTPQIADTVCEQIRFWNILDEENLEGISIREPIKIYINSLGGSLDAAITILNAIEISKTPVFTFNIGTVYKESFLIYLAGHKRYAYPNSMFMYTDSIYPVNSESNENESSFYCETDAQNELTNNMREFFIDRVSSINENQYNKHIKSNWWFTATEAQKAHIVNEISKNHYYTKKNNR